MRQLVLTLLLLTALAALAWLADQTGPAGNINAVDTVPATTSTPSAAEAPWPNNADPVALRLSTRLGVTPGAAPATAAPGDTRSPGPRERASAAGVSRNTLRQLGWLLAAAALGMLFVRYGSAQRKASPAAGTGEPTPADIPSQSPSVPATGELPLPDMSPDSGGLARASEADQARIESLTADLAAAQDDLHSARDARDDLTRQVDGLNESLAESQQQSSRLMAELSEREHELALARQRLDEVIAHDEEATTTVTDLAAKLGELDNDGVEQRVITVQFEKALLAADTQIMDLEAQLARTHADIELLNGDIDTTSRQLADEQEARAARDAQLETLTGEVDALSAQLTSARTELGDRESRLAELTGVQERLDNWQSTVDTYRRDLRERDRRLDELGSALDDRDAHIEALTLTTQEIAPLKNKIREQEAVARILKDAADSMRLHKARSDERGAAIASLKDALERERQHDARLRGQLSELRAAHEAAQGALDDARRDLNEARRDATQSAERIATLDADLADARADAAAQRKAAVDTRDTLTSLVTELIDDVGALTEHSGAMHDQLSTNPPALPPETQVDIAELRAALDDQLGRATTAAAAGAQREQQLADDLAVTGECLVRLESVGARDDAQLRVTLSDRDELAALGRRLESHALGLERELAVRDAERVDAECDRIRLGELNNTIEALRRHEDALTVRLTATLARRDAIARQAADLRSARDAAEADAGRTRVQAVALNHARDTALAQLARTTQSLEQTTEARELDARERQSVEQQMQSLNAALDDAKNAVHKQTAELTLLENEIAQREKSLAAATEQLSERDARLDAAGAALASASEERMRLETALAELREKADTRVDEMAAANLALRDTIKEVRRDADRDVQRLRSAAEQAEETARAVTRQLEETRVELDAGRTRIEQLAAEVESKTGELASQTEAARERRRRVLKLEAELKQQNAALQRQLDVMTVQRDRIGELQSELDTRRAEQERQHKPTRLMDKPVRVPVLKKRVAAPPLLKRAVSDDDETPGDPG